MRNETYKAKVTAETAYQNAHIAAQDALSRINELLSDLPAPEAGSVNWGHVGNLTEVNSRLSSVIAFLNGTER